MSPATLAASSAAESDRPSEEWLSLAEASRVSKLHETTVLRCALAGDVAHRIRGRRTLFRRADVLAVAG
jgi:N-glycosylase/DNA lyase